MPSLADATLANLLARIEMYAGHPLLKDYEIATEFGELWVRLKGIPERVPPAAAPLRYESANPRQFEIPVQVRYRSYDEWYDEKLFWLPYVLDGRRYVDATGATSLSWMYVDYEDTKDFQDPQHPGRFNNTVLRIIQQDFVRAGELLDLLDGKAGFRRRMVSTSFNANNLHLCRSAISIQYQLCLARPAMLEAIGAISYIYHHLEDGLHKDVLRSVYGDQFRDWLILDAPKMGTLLDLRRDYEKPVPLLKWLRDDVPVYFPWEEPYRPSRPLSERLEEPDEVTPEEFAEALERVAGGVWPDADVAGEHAADLDRSLADELDTEAAIPFSAKGDTLYRQLLGQANSVMQPMLFFNRPEAFPLNGQSWSDSLLENGIFRAPRITEVKLRIYALRYRSTDMADVLAEALQRGMEFTVTFPTTFIMRKHRERTPPRPVPPYIKATYVDPVLPYHPDGLQAAWLQYLRNVEDLLERPHAAAFLFLGGILSRLAREFGPVDRLVRTALVGPSASVLDYLHGERDVPGQVRDFVSPGEIACLLGATYGRENDGIRHWWPFPSDFVANEFFAGEWTEVHEAWFTRRLQRIAAGHKLGRPLTEREWKKDLGGWSQRLHEDREEFPSHDVIESLREGLASSMGDWKNVPLSQIRLFDA